MTNFEKWDNEFRRQNLFAFNNDKSALLYLKVRALRRRKQMQCFIAQNKIRLTSQTIEAQFSELYSIMENRTDAMSIIDAFLRERDNEWYREKGVDEEKLKSDLRKIRNYEWGGDQENSLDKYLVRRYIKEISDFDKLESEKDSIAANSWNFVQTSWYNNWTSYLIESIFKKHRSVLSAVGEIKSVDFFIADYPIDLKVTYFPEAYMGEKLKEVLGCTELTWLKQKAKSVGIMPDKNLSGNKQYDYLREELENQGHKDVIIELISKRQQIIDDAQKNPNDLMKWLYEKQSPRLFGSENRLFIVLVDLTDIGQSWKLKRAFSLIEPNVNDYLNRFSSDSLKEISFTFNRTVYRSLADIIFVLKK